MDTQWLKVLTDAPWHERAAGVSDARDVPGAILGLISSDPTIRQEAYWKLDNHIVVQSDLYPAAFYVIPFLIELLSDRVPNGRDRIYNLLIEIANGNAPPDVTCTLESGDHKPLKEACRMALMRGVGTFERDVLDEDRAVGGKAEELIRRLADRD